MNKIAPFKNDEYNPQKPPFGIMTVIQIDRIFDMKKKKLGVEAELDLEFLDHPPVVDKNVYGEAFPERKRVMLDVFPEATMDEIETVICEELVHIKHPELRHGSKYWEKVKECVLGNCRGV